jgi:16S rRNA processing protein RimM
MIVMGRICAPYGVKGWIKILPYTTEPDQLVQFPVWWLGKEPGATWERKAVAEVKCAGRSLTASLEGVADREAASRLKGMHIALPRSALPAPEAGEYYLFDLLGLAVVNRQDESLGIVAGFLETGANLVLRVHAERERLIPFAEAVIEEVQLSEGWMRVDWDASD